ncbi:MAG: 50S ribosomal protein L23 [Chloroflexi bacterium]|nr:50S ribosomal protein L23 [Chloroflexota bacterium]
MHVYQVLKRPLVTEKVTANLPLGKYAFEVDPAANKLQIKQAVEVAFNVTVSDVNVLRIPGKLRRVGKHRGMTSGYKKAIVTLQPGDKIELFEGV